MLRTVLAMAAAGAGLAFGQSNAPRPEFEVASVRVNTDNGRSDFEPRRSGDRIIMHNMQIGPMITYAYNVPRGIPMEGNWRLPDGWNWYDVEATIGESRSGHTDAEIRLMFQSLLEDRFKLKVHHETKELPIYTLTLAKKGPKLKEWRQGEPPLTVIGKLVPDGIVANYSSREDPHHIVGRKASMAKLAEYLTGALQSPVTDKTALAGDFDFELAWDSDEPALASPDPALVAAVLQEQLGLKLEKSKGPVEILVVDHVEKPSGN
ncbi:MAG TPA: TIGR03435 family protein [Bryobacteraceae bacterium]